jgi:HSP20 family protein
MSNNEIVKWPSIFDGTFLDTFMRDWEDGFKYAQPATYPTDIVEIKDKEGNVTGHEVDIALAGIPKDNISVTVEPDKLVIKVEKKEKENTSERNYVRKGISHRSMMVTYGLHGVDSDKIEATFEEGMLKVKLPKTNEVKPKQLKIG